MHRPFPIQQPQPLTFPPLPSCSLTLQGVTDFLFFFFCCMSSLALISFSSSRRGAWNSPSFRISYRGRKSQLFPNFKPVCFKTKNRISEQNSIEVINVELYFVFFLHQTEEASVKQCRLLNSILVKPTLNQNSLNNSLLRRNILLVKARFCPSETNINLNRKENCQRPTEYMQPLKLYTFTFAHISALVMSMGFLPMKDE